MSRGSRGAVGRQESREAPGLSLSYDDIVEDEEDEEDYDAGDDDFRSDAGAEVQDEEEDDEEALVGDDSGDDGMTSGRRLRSNRGGGRGRRLSGASEEPQQTRSGRLITRVQRLGDATRELTDADASNGVGRRGAIRAAARRWTSTGSARSALRGSNSSPGVRDWRVGTARRRERGRAARVVADSDDDEEVGDEEEEEDVFDEAVLESDEDGADEEAGSRGNHSSDNDQEQETASARRRHGRGRPTASQASTTHSAAANTLTDDIVLRDDALDLALAELRRHGPKCTVDDILGPAPRRRPPARSRHLSERETNRIAHLVSDAEFLGRPFGWAAGALPTPLDYVPQTGDVVVYVVAGHRAWLATHPATLQGLANDSPWCEIVPVEVGDSGSHGSSSARGAGDTGDSGTWTAVRCIVSHVEFASQAETRPYQAVGSAEKALALRLHTRRMLAAQAASAAQAAGKMARDTSAASAGGLSGNMVGESGAALPIKAFVELRVIGATAVTMSDAVARVRGAGADRLSDADIIRWQPAELRVSKPAPAAPAASSGGAGIGEVANGVAFTVETFPSPCGQEDFLVPAPVFDRGVAAGARALANCNPASKSLRAAAAGAAAGAAAAASTPSVCVAVPYLTAPYDETAVFGRYDAWDRWDRLIRRQPLAETALGQAAGNTGWVYEAVTPPERTGGAAAPVPGQSGADRGLGRAARGAAAAIAASSSSSSSSSSPLTMPRSTAAAGDDGTSGDRWLRKTSIRSRERMGLGKLGTAAGAVPTRDAVPNETARPRRRAAAEAAERATRQQRAEQQQEFESAVEAVPGARPRRRSERRTSVPASEAEPASSGPVTPAGRRKRPRGSPATPPSFEGSPASFVAQPGEYIVVADTAAEAQVQRDAAANRTIMEADPMAHLGALPKPDAVWQWQPPTSAASTGVGRCVGSSAGTLVAEPASHISEIRCSVNAAASRVVSLDHVTTTAAPAALPGRPQTTVTAVSWSTGTAALSAWADAPASDVMAVPDDEGDDGLWKSVRVTFSAPGSTDRDSFATGAELVSPWEVQWLGEAEPFGALDESNAESDPSNLCPSDAVALATRVSVLPSLPPVGRALMLRILRCIRNACPLWIWRLAHPQNPKTLPAELDEVALPFSLTLVARRLAHGFYRSWAAAAADVAMLARSRLQQLGIGVQFRSLSDSTDSIGPLGMISMHSAIEAEEEALRIVLCSMVVLLAMDFVRSLTGDASVAHRALAPSTAMPARALQKSGKASGSGLRPKRSKPAVADPSASTTALAPIGRNGRRRLPTTSTLEQRAEPVTLLSALWPSLDHFHARTPGDASSFVALAQAGATLMAEVLEQGDYDEARQPEAEPKRECGQTLAIPKPAFPDSLRIENLLSGAVAAVLKLCATQGWRDLTEKPRWVASEGSVAITASNDEIEAAAEVEPEDHQRRVNEINNYRLLVSHVCLLPCMAQQSSVRDGAAVHASLASEATAHWLAADEAQAGHRSGLVLRLTSSGLGTGQYRPVIMLEQQLPGGDKVPVEYEPDCQSAGSGSGSSSGTPSLDSNSHGSYSSSSSESPGSQSSHDDEGDVHNDDSNDDDDDNNEDDDGDNDNDNEEVVVRSRPLRGRAADAGRGGESLRVKLRSRRQ